MTKQTRTTHEIMGEVLSEETRSSLLNDLDEFAARIRSAVEDGTFQAAIFTVMVDTGETDPEDGSCLSRVSGYRHGFADATATLMQDAIDRYAAATFGEMDEDNGHAH